MGFTDREFGVALVPVGYARNKDVRLPLNIHYLLLFDCCKRVRMNFRRMPAVDSDDVLARVGVVIHRLDRENAPSLRIESLLDERAPAPTPAS